MEESNKRIAKNTIYLYIRTFAMMLLSFYSTRIVLDKLGAADYGVNNLVSGFVSAFTVMNSILQGGTRRFLALNLGKGDADLLKRTFSTSFVIHLVVAIIIVIVLEICGPWFISNRLNIEPNRLWAALWVFQFSVIGVFMGVTQTPYVAVITAHEKFNMYAYMSIYDVVAKLLVLFLLVYIPFDKLIVYAFLQLLVNVTSILIYRIYCIRKFQECKPSLEVDKPLCKEMLQFSGWTVLGHVTVVLNGQGSRILLNLFYSTVINAAEGLANVVSTTINSFVSGFTIAGEPQLVKYYGMGDKEHFEKLIFNISQYTIFIIAFIAVPVFMELEYVLGLWLTEVPQYTAQFVKVGLVCNLVHTSNGMIDRGLVAGGYVKQLNTISIPLYLFSLPLVYFVLVMKWNPTFVYIAGTIPAVFAFGMNLYLIKKYMNFPARRYFSQVFLKNCVLIGVACIPPYIVQQFLDDGLLRFLFVCSVAVFSTIIVMWHFAMNEEVREIVRQKVVNKVFR